MARTMKGGGGQGVPFRGDPPFPAASSRAAWVLAGARLISSARADGEDRPLAAVVKRAAAESGVKAEDVRRHQVRVN